MVAIERARVSRSFMALRP